MLPPISNVLIVRLFSVAYNLSNFNNLDLNFPP